MDGEQKTEQAAVNMDAQGGGQQPVRMFTQQDVDSIVTERLSRQKAQYADYADLKAKAQKWAEAEEAQKTETQKLAERAAMAERERDEALQQAQSRLIRAAFIAEAAKAGAAHPDDVYALADISSVMLDDQNNVVGVTEAVKAVIEAGRVPIAQQRAPNLDAGAGSGRRAGEQQAAALSEQELEQARKLRITPEQYAKNKVGKHGK